MAVAGLTVFYLSFLTARFSIISVSRIRLESERNFALFAIILYVVGRLILVLENAVLQCQILDGKSETLPLNKRLIQFEAAHSSSLHVLSVSLMSTMIVTS